jgi:polyhydroxyalkanoate synthesis regulator phasin
MASKKNDDGMVNRLAGRGEEAVSRLVEELSKNPRVTDAMARAVEAKGRIDQSARGALAQVGVAAADELKELRKQIERLERRLSKLETKESGSTTSAKKSETKETPSAKKGTTTKKAPTAKKTADKASSPAPGRSLGGGTGRGSSAS